MEIAKKYHTGFRKDGVTPNFQHQVSIALFLRTLEAYFIYPEETFVVAFLHDTIEDFGDDAREEVGRRIKTYSTPGRSSIAYPNPLSLPIELVNKHKNKGNMLVAKPKEDFFGEIQTCPIASLVKPADRSNNLQTMVGVFTKEKQLSYINEAEMWYLPMMKVARRNFPQQELAYENMKHMLQSQIQLLKASLHGK